VTDALVTLGALLAQAWALIPLQPVHPPRSNGFAASVLAALMAIGLLAIVAKFATTKPKNRRRRPRD
jgi:hypothetical protein